MVARRAVTLGVLVALAAACVPSGSGAPTSAPTAADPSPSLATPSGTTAPPATPRATESSRPSETAEAGVERWVRATPAGRPPSAREDHTWTVDEAGRYAYLFGGRDGGAVFADLWRFDLETDRWVALAPRGPAPAGRFGHTGTWVPGRGLVVWSGQRGSQFFNDLWLYRPSANRWTRLDATGSVPDARYGSCASLGPDGRLWISHGFTEDSGRFSDTRAYDFASERWTEQRAVGDAPVIRCLHDCLWTPDGRFVLYAGQTSGVRAIGDAWSFAAGGGQRVTWQRQPAPPLAPRNLYALAAVGTSAYVFGGTPLEGAKLADSWKLDLQTLAWSPLTARGPSGRSGAALISDAARKRLVLFGGQTDGGEVADTWELRLPG